MDLSLEIGLGLGLGHGCPEGGQPGAVAPHPWNLKIMASYAVSVQNTLKFLLASSALASITLKVSLKRRKNRENFRSRLRRAKNRPCSRDHAGLPPCGKIRAGAHGLGLGLRLGIGLGFGLRLGL